MQPAPHRAIPAPRAVVAICSRSPSPNALPKITAALSPRLAASSTWAASAASGTPSSTRSTGRGSAASEGWHGTPPISRYFGLTRYIAGDAGVRRGTGVIQAGDRRAVVGEAGRGAHVEQLLQRQLTVEDVAADQPVVVLHVVGADDVAVHDGALEVGRQLVVAVDHPVGVG